MLNNNRQKPSIKYVKRANRWCVTYWLGATQKQEWFSTEAEAVAFVVEGKK